MCAFEHILINRGKRMTPYVRRKYGIIELIALRVPGDPGPTCQGCLGFGSEFFWEIFQILANTQKCCHWPLSPHFCSTFESLTNDIQSIVTKSTLSLSLFKVEFRPQKPKIYCRTYRHYLEFSLNCLVKTFYRTGLLLNKSHFTLHSFKM